MRYKIYGKEISFQYYSSGDGIPTCLDISKVYEELGGKIETETELEFVEYFPDTPYEKTALTNKMPPAHLCEGSGSAIFYQPDGRVDHLAISVYRDTTGHSNMVSHHNLRLQYKIGGEETKQKEKIPNNHIPLEYSVIIEGIVDGKEVFSKEVG